MPLDEETPAYLPARMLNEFVYCPRLFYYEWAEATFVHNLETTEGAFRHARVDERSDALAPAGELPDEERVHARSVQLSSEAHRLIATIDLVEAEGATATPVDYKRGAPFKNEETGELSAWPPDRVQLAVQALVLLDNGYACNEAIVYYMKTKQRVRVPIDAALVEETLRAIADARAAAASDVIPPPLVDSPKCPRCSLVGICLPDETRYARDVSERDAEIDETAPNGEPPLSKGGDRVQPRRLVAARDDLKPLYLNTQGLHVGKSGNVLKIKEKDRVVEERRIGEICQVGVFGGIQLTTQAIQALCENEVPIAYFSQGGWFYGVTHGLGVRNIALRRSQFRLADDPAFRLGVARDLVAGKIRNQRTMLQRNHIEPNTIKLARMKCLADDAEQATSLEQLLGIEGNAARLYFESFSGMIKVGGPMDDLAANDVGNGGPLNRGAGDAGPLNHECTNSESLNLESLNSKSLNLESSNLKSLNLESSNLESSNLKSLNLESSNAKSPTRGPEFSFDFTHRNRRPPRDPVNALLSLAYSVLAKDLTIVCHAVGFDPFLGFYHQPRFGRAPMALDLMEPFRPLIADSAVLSVINNRMVSPRDFIRAGQSVALRPDGRKAFFRAYEKRMDTLVTHPLFGYRLNYRRMLEIQARLLARVVTGEIEHYPVFVTR